MTAIETDDLVVVTGPLSLYGLEEGVYLTPGEVAQVVKSSFEGNELFTQVVGFESGMLMWIDASSLTPLSEIYNRSDVQWGDPLDPDYVVLDGGAVDAEESSFVLAAWSDEDQAYWGDLIDIDLSAIHDYVHEEEA